MDQIPRALPHTTLNHGCTKRLRLAWSIGLVCCAAAHAQDISKLPAGEGLAPKGFTVKKSGNVTNIEADGNMGPNKPFTGSSLDEIEPENNPVDLALRAVALFKSDRTTAHRIALAAQALARFDTARVSDPSAHDAYGVLFETGGIRDILVWGRFKPDRQRADLAAVADWAKRTAPPTYAPRWMVQHGMAVLQSALAGGEPGSGLVPDFDAAQAWRKGYEKLYAFIEDEARWKKMREDATPEALAKQLESLRTTACEALKKQDPGQSEKFENDLKKLFGEVDPNSEDFGLQFLSAQYALERYVKQFLEYHNAPVASKVEGKPNWIKSPHDGSVLDATGLQPGQFVKDPSTGKIMRLPK